MGYVIHAVFVVIAAYFLGVHYQFPAILLGLAGISLLFIRTGIEINVEKKEISNYQSLFGLKRAKKIRLDNMKKADLVYTKESQVMNSRGTSTNVRTKTYDLYFTDKNNHRIKFHEFTDYRTARRACNTIEKMLNWVIYDEYLEIKRKAAKYKVTK